MIMIKPIDVFSIGHFYKTHGVTGELSLSYTSDVFDRTKSPYFVLDMDGILVPFFIKSCRLRSGTDALICFDGIEDERKAKEFVGKEVYYTVTYADEDEESEEQEEGWGTIIGFQVIDEIHGQIGELVDIDDSTINILLIVSDGIREVQIPAAGDFFKSVDTEQRILHVNLPDGLLDI